MFSSLGLFKQTPSTQQKTAHTLESDEDVDRGDGSRKRRRISRDIRDDISSIPTLAASSLPSKKPSTEPSQKSVEALPRTASRLISPPPLRADRAPTSKPTLVSGTKAAAFQSNGNVSSPLSNTRQELPPKTTAPEESLNPRMLLNPPVSHPIRLRLLAMLHEQMARLNDELKKSDDASKATLTLSDAELIRQALDEEFQTAKKNPTVYQNLIKSRIMVLKKMKLAVWKDERGKKVAERLPKSVSKQPGPPKPIETGLTPAEEISFVPRLAAQQEGLNKHGYITTVPTETELETARKGVESAQGWEQCDRCSTRFQVFPGRREEDGALTSGGQCTYHWAKPRRPDTVKGENKSRDLKYACCDETVGVSTGCTKAHSHVFKISDPKRLTLIMPFETTPVSDRTDIPGAVCFDCEMGYTTMGMELIRLTATAWPDGREVLDVLVRPLGEVLDLNSRFSGVWPDDYASAAPYDKAAQEPTDDEKPRLQLVDSPSRARELLFEHLRPDTPLIGHALENDLNAVRILHPIIVDTALLYPHPRGLPMRFGLKMLMKKYLNRDIQTAGAQGHDSKEDARAAGDLVRYRIGEMWRKMKGEGWRKQEGDFIPPFSDEAALCG
ncbi:MAG: hypothetical protein Q9223_007640 [Gallowayella weberi]